MRLFNAIPGEQRYENENAHIQRKLDKWLLLVPDTSIITRRQQKAIVYIVYQASHRRKE